MLEFGSRVEGAVYVERPGAYAVIADASGNIAVVQTPRGCFLPGGAIDAGEAADAALHREVREELGCAAHIIRKLGVAAQYVYAVDENRYFKKVGHFYVAGVGPKTASATELDHDLVWRSPSEAISALSQEFQRWAVRQAVSTGIA